MCLLFTREHYQEEGANHNEQSLSHPVLLLLSFCCERKGFSHVLSLLLFTSLILFTNDGPGDDFFSLSIISLFHKMYIMTMRNGNELRCI